MSAVHGAAIRSDARVERLRLRSWPLRLSQSAAISFIFAGAAAIASCDRSDLRLGGRVIARCTATVRDNHIRSTLIVVALARADDDGDR
jgi:hypothetical protein